jgi:hypothetical protein
MTIAIFNEKSMKKIFALAIFGVTSLITYCAITRKRTWQTQSTRDSFSRDKNHHVTNVFAKAKQYTSKKD